MTSLSFSLSLLPVDLFLASPNIYVVSKIFYCTMKAVTLCSHSLSPFFASLSEPASSSSQITPLCFFSALVLSPQLHSSSSMKSVSSFIIPTASPPPFYLASSPPLTVASNFAVLFEQILILPAQLFFPLTLAQLCLLHFVILCSSSVYEAVSFAAKAAATFPL